MNPLENKRLTNSATKTENIGTAFQFLFEFDSYDDLQNAVSPLKGQVSKDPKTAAVILAGGQGERFGNPLGKQLQTILGKPIVTWSAEAFDSVADVGIIILVCPEDRMEEYCAQAIDPYPFVTPIVLVAAGEMRQYSSAFGVQMVPEEYEIIAIHDGARPLATSELIMQTIATVKGDIDIDGAIVGHKAIDTLKILGGENIIGTPDRDAFFVAQTPQVFRASSIRNAHVAAITEGFIGTDDSSLIERLGGNIKTVVGPRHNIKITVPDDLYTAETILATRLGMKDK